MARRYQILGILNIYVGFILDQLGTSSIWCLEIDTTSTTPFHRFTTGIACKFTEPILLVANYLFLTSILGYWRGLALILPIQYRSTSLRLVLCVNLLKGPRSLIFQ
jgi:hypothetical protein